jgi:N utilization substance protein A
MAGSTEILTAIRDLSHLKQIERSELHELLQDGIHAALAKKHGPTVQAEVDIDDDKGDIRIVLLKTVVESVADPAREITLEEARFEDPEYQVGDLMEIPVDFTEFASSNACAKASARRFATSSTTASATCCRARSSRSSAARSS